MTAIIRPATPDDSRACFAVFRASLADLLRRTGHPGADAVAAGADEHWSSYEELFAHFAATAAQWWVATDGGRIVGYARSVPRGDILELTEFFVAPETRVAGIGRALLERAFAPGLGAHRSIIATVDPPAVALYLRFGVAHQTTGLDLTGTPRPVALPDGYVVDEQPTLDELAGLEAQLLGHGRREDLAYMLTDRPARLLRRGGRAVAYAFCANAGGYAGPVGALDPADMPAALAIVENAAYEAGLQSLDLTVPLSARTAVDHLLGARGFRIDPFYCLFLADGPWAKLDRYLPFNPCLIL